MPILYSYATGLDKAVGNLITVGSTVYTTDIKKNRLIIRGKKNMHKKLSFEEI